MIISSSAFDEGEMIPKHHTCDGPNLSPPLDWTSVPGKAQSLAVICDDPDAPAGTRVHWVYYDIPAGVSQLPEGIAPDSHPPTGGTQGINDFKRIGFGGPCPPSGTHRYYFRLYALDTLLNLKAGASKKQLIKAMEGHILGQAQLMGRYKR